MNDTTRINIVVVDLAKTLLRESSCMLLATGDEYANRFGAIIVRNGEAVDIANFMVSGSFIRPDGVTLTLEGVSEGNTVYVDLPSECYKYDGVFTLSIKIVKGDVTETVRMVDGYIRRTETGNYVADEETIITLDKIQGMANEMAQLYEQAKETMEELSGATENLENALEEAETLPEKLPYIGDNGNWMQWDDDAGKFIDSGSPSRGIPGVNGTTPVKGKDYFDGEPGYTPQKNIDYFDGTSVTITNVSQSTADGGTNVVTFSDGKKLNVRNGSKGKDGEDGRTPVAGTDYFTEADKAELVEEVKSQIREVDGDYAPAIHADQHSWNDTLTWDGDTTGKVTVDPWGDGSEMWYRVSDVVPTMDDLADGYVIKYFLEDTGETEAYYHSLEESVEGGWTDHDGGMYNYAIAIIPTDNYTFQEFRLPTIPKKGIYFTKWPSDGCYISSLTILGYKFTESADPITPEMIGAAPSYHASKYNEHGVGTDKKYGHLKVADLGDIFIPSDDLLMTLPPEMDEDDPQGSLKNYAFSAFMGYVTNNLFTTWLTDVDNQLTMAFETIKALKKEVNTLKSEVEALKGGS